MTSSTSWAAWIGAATGIFSLAWNIYLKVTSGPKLKIHPHAGMIMMPPQPGNPRYLRIIVRNVGTAPTTITNYTLHTFKGFRSRFKRTEFNADKSAVVTNYSGKQCPAKLDVGEELNVLMTHDAMFEEWLKDDLWLGVSHSFGHGAQLARVYDGRNAKCKSSSARPTADSSAV